MADAQPHNTPDNLSANRRPRGREDEASPVTNGEHRSFGAQAADAKRRSDEMVDVARDLSQTTVQATRELSERSRQMGREMAANWRDAMEPLFAMPLEMNRWLEEMWGQTTGAGAFAGLHAARPFAGWSMASMLGLPATDVKETESAYLLHVELPGLSREELELSVRGDNLAISGHKFESKDDSGSAYRMSERRFGSFERRFPIPADIDRSKIEARYRDGLLTVTLPKTETAARRQNRIEIKG